MASLDLDNPTEEQRLCVELLLKRDKELDAAGMEIGKLRDALDTVIDSLRIAEAVRDDARAHSQRLLDENRELKAQLAQHQYAPDEIEHAVRLAGCYLTGGDSPPLRADTTPTLARAVIALHAKVEKLREAGLALRDTAIDIENQRHKAAGEAINAELERDIKIVELKSELAAFKVRVAPILRAMCEAGDDTPAMIQALKAMPFVRDLIREWTCECDRSDHKGHRYDCELYQRLRRSTR